MEFRREKKMAVAMGLHSRLGVDSALACIDPEILHMIFVAGEVS